VVATTSLRFIIVFSDKPQRVWRHIQNAWHFTHWERRKLL
jgi:hypothetical protein